MDKNVEKNLETMDNKSKREIQELGQSLVEAGVLNIVEAKSEEVYSKSPNSTPLPVAQETHVQRY